MTGSSAYYPRLSSAPPDHHPRSIMRQPHVSPRAASVPRETPPTSADPAFFPKRHSLPSTAPSPRVAHRDRFTSLQHDLPLNINAYERDRVAHASGQAPSPILPLDPPVSNPKISSPHTRSRPLDALPPRMPKPHPQHFIRRLELLLRAGRLRMCDQLDPEDVMEMHEVDLRQQERIAKGKELEKHSNSRVFGVPLKDVAMYASSTTILGGYQHDLPNVVFSCVEELYRTGIYQHGLFRTLPNRERHMELVRRFDTPTPDFSLRAESTPDICALLSAYLSALPETILPMTFYGALWVWCVKPSVLREDQRREREEWEEEEARERRWGAKAKHSKHAPQSRAPAPPPLPPSHDDIHALEADQVAIAQILFRLLPGPQFSLLVYLCAFFTQIPLCPENGLAFDDIAHIFGQTLLGGSKRESARMMGWLLTRWWRISEGLLEAEEGGRRESSPPAFAEALRRREGITPTRESVNAHRRDMSPRSREELVYPGDRRRDASPHRPVYDNPTEPPRRREESPPRRESVAPRMRDISPRNREEPAYPEDKRSDIGDRPTHDAPAVARLRQTRLASPVIISTPHTSPESPNAPSTPVDAQPPGPESPIPQTHANAGTTPQQEYLLPSDRLFEMDRMSFTDSASVYSTATEPESPSSVLSSLNRIILLKDSELADHSLRNSQAQALLSEAHTRILNLEHALERHDVVVTDALAQTSLARDETRALAVQLAALEEAKREGDERLRRTEGSGIVNREALTRQLEGVSSERDRARQLVENIRKLLEVT